MASPARHVSETDAPDAGSPETLDARELPPPQPLRNTLERLAEAEVPVVLVQVNDRRPQHLYPRLDERGYEYDTREDGGDVVTVIWRS